MMTKSSTTSTTSDSSSQPDAPVPEPKTGSSLDDLSERIGHSDAEPDLARQLAENWQKFFGAMVLVLLGVWLLGEFRAASQLEKEDASFRFQNAQEAYATLISEESAGNNENAEKARRIFLENLTLLEKGNSESVYEELAPLYQAQAAIDAGNLEQAKATLATLGVTNAQGIPSSQSVNSTEQFVGELASLLYARVLTLSEGDRAAERAYVSSLCERARFVNLEALLLLYRTSNSEGEKEEAKALAKKIITARPELAESIRTAFEGLGVALS